MQKSVKSTKTTVRRALPPADPTLTKPEVIAQLSLTHMTKSIEQVGTGYEALKKRFASLEEKMKNGASAHLSESEDDASEPEEAKRERAISIDTPAKALARKDREAIEKVFCKEGNLYGVLELEHLTWEATVKQARKQYQKKALKYHPDKLGENITEEQKQMWLTV